MLQFLRTGVVVLAGTVFALCSLHPAEAGCQLVTATHSANSKAEAAQSSRALAVQSAYELKAAKRWSYVTMSARRVKGDPFWKAVGPTAFPPTLSSSPIW